MKLSEIRNLAESRVDPNILLSLQMIIKQGKVAETMQCIVLARMLEMLKNGTFYKEPNFYEVNVSTSKALLDTIRALDAKDQVDLAKRVLELLEVKDRDDYYMYANPTQETLAWIKWVTSKEAND